MAEQMELLVGLREEIHNFIHDLRRVRGIVSAWAGPSVGDGGGAAVKSIRIKNSTP